MLIGINYRNTEIAYDFQVGLHCLFILLYASYHAQASAYVGCIAVSMALDIMRQSSTAQLPWILKLIIVIMCVTLPLSNVYDYWLK